jgi:uncharacterized protein
MQRMTYLLLFLIVTYAGLVALLYVAQRKLIYLPDKNIESPEAYGLSGFSDERATGSDGVAVQLWYHAAQTGFPTIVYYHGNASHIGNRAGILAALADQGFGVLGVSYRGYGKSAGAPSEQGIYADARAAIAFLTENKKIPISSVALFGESLGTGVAVQMATEYPVAMLILQAPYKSVAGRAGELYYWVPVNFLIKDRFDSIDKIARVKAPLLIFHGELDTIIPIGHGRALYDKAASPKRSHFLPRVAHNDFDSGFISSHVLDFAREQGLIQ